MARDRARHWQRHVQRWKASGLSRAVYASKHGFTPQTLGVWIRRFAGQGAKKAKPSKRFVAVKVATPRLASYPAPRNTSVRVLLTDGTVIEASDGDLPTIARLVELLRGRMQ